MQRVFDQANIIECVINEEELMAFLLRQDVNDVGEKYFPFKDLARLLLMSYLSMLSQTTSNRLNLIFI